MTNNALAIFRNAIEIYTYLCQPVCKKFSIQQSALDILYFLAKNPEKNTAVDIQKIEGIKQSMVSFHVERLVNDGYIERLAVPGDRRKVKLVCTEKASQPVDECAKIRKKVLSYMTEGISEDELKVYEKVSNMIGDNIINCRELMLKGKMN